MFEGMDVSASALLAQRIRMDTIAGNVANMNTTRDPNGNLSPYQRRFVVLEPGQPDDPSEPGVHVAKIGVDNSPPRLAFDPTNPDAGPDGYVRTPNIDLAIEQVNMMDATRAYDANATMIDSSKAMISEALRLLA
jgi:flagellar basal-body rod protein FlgC